MRDLTYTENFDDVTLVAMFSRILALKTKIRVCAEREKDMLRSRKGVNYDKRMAKKKREDLEVIARVLKRRLAKEVGKKTFKRQIINIIRKEDSLFKNFLVENYDFAGWKDTYDSAVLKRAMKDSDVERIAKTKMYEKYIDYVVKS